MTASGGDETVIAEAGRYWRVHTFTASGVFQVSRGGRVEYLLVGGGGAGGGTGSGGGGGGGRAGGV
ncbi:MAG: hypothetical protein JJU40_09435, partial [Rhodobacteraceae bacterium]|nr:hypothetical protein [Paracoccaceae bacterium]